MDVNEVAEQQAHDDMMNTKQQLQDCREKLEDIRRQLDQWAEQSRHQQFLDCMEI